MIKPLQHICKRIRIHCLTVFINSDKATPTGTYVSGQGISSVVMRAGRYLATYLSVTKKFDDGMRFTVLMLRHQLTYNIIKPKQNKANQASML